MGRKKRIRAANDPYNDVEMYYPEAYESGAATRKQMAAEYSQLRRAALKRLKNLEKAGYSDRQAYIRNVDRFIPVSQVNSGKDLSKLLYEVHKFMSAKQSSVTGIRKLEKEAIARAHEKGWTWLNHNNIHQFGNFMEYMRARYGERQFDSERAAELFAVGAAQKGMSPLQLAKEFEYWKDNVEELEQTPKFRSKKNRTSANYRERLEQLRNKGRFE